MRIGIKFCGGCNPLYERQKIVERIKREYPLEVVEAIRDGTVYDFIIILNGCRAECVDYKDLRGNFGRIDIFCADDYTKIQEAISKYYKMH